MITDPYTALNAMLANNTAVTSLLGKFLLPDGTPGTIPLIQGGRLAETETDLPCIVFNASPGDTEKSLSNYYFTVNCYAETERESYLIALKIVEEFNECDSGLEGYFARTTCDILTPVVNPLGREVNTPMNFRIVNI